MMLLGILSKYSWGDFLTFLFAVDGIILAFGFALDRFVWSKDSGLTKNERRNQREEADDEVERRDYRKLSESASDYNEVKSVDDSFDSDENFSLSEEDYNVPSYTTNIADQLVSDDGETDTEGDNSPVESPVLDEEEENPVVVNDEDIEENNNLAEEKFLSEEEGCEVISDDNFEEENNREYLEEEDGPGIFATSPQEELTDVQLLDENDEPYTINADDMMGLEDAIPYDLPVMDDPADEDGPSFDAD